MKRFITPTPLLLPDNIAGQRSGPEIKDAIPVYSADEENLATKKDLVWSRTRLQDVSHQTVPSWTGFNIQCRTYILISRDIVGYLPTINAPATHLSPVYGILSQAQTIRTVLNLEEIVCVFDQALYAKAAEIVWKHHDTFCQVILSLGAFHTMCMLLSVIGKRFRDAGLPDLAVESGVIAEGSIDSVLEGRQYNRGMRLHRLGYEALLRLSWKGFYSWLEHHHLEDNQLLPNFSKFVEQLHEKPCSETLSVVLNDPACNQILERFDEYLNTLRLGQW